MPGPSAALQTHGYAKDPEDAAYKAVTAGLDMDMASLTYPKNLAGLVHSGKVTEAQARRSRAAHPRKSKYELGLFDHPYVDESKVDSTLSRPEGRELERKVAARSMVLLKNDNHTLPFEQVHQEDRRHRSAGRLRPRHRRRLDSRRPLRRRHPRAIPSRYSPASRTSLAQVLKSITSPAQRPRAPFPSLFDAISRNQTAAASHRS